MPALVKKSFFKKLQHFKADYAPATLTQYVSERTGMNVVVVNQKGPKVCITSTPNLQSAY